MIDVSRLIIGNPPQFIDCRGLESLLLMEIDQITYAADRASQC